MDRHGSLHIRSGRAIASPERVRSATLPRGHEVPPVSTSRRGSLPRARLRIPGSSTGGRSSPKKPVWSARSTCVGRSDRRKSRRRHGATPMVIVAGTVLVRTVEQGHPVLAPVSAQGFQRGKRVILAGTQEQPKWRSDQLELHRHQGTTTVGRTPTGSASRATCGLALRSPL